MIKKIFLTSCLVALGFSLSSCAYLGKHHHKKHAKKMFHKMDTNNDGFVTKLEMRKFSEKKFKMIDANKDGKLCLSEFLDHKKHRKNK